MLSEHSLSGFLTGNVNGVNVIGIALQTPSVVPSLAVIRHPSSDSRSLVPSGGK